jgi:acyl-CoA synthetase (AMP-forming)/AMP-acid ligase II
MEKTNNNNFDIITKIQKNIENHPNKIALVFQDKTITFKELDLKSGYLANYLKKKGVEKYDRVIVMIPISSNLFYTIFALIKLGATIVFIDPKMKFKNIGNSCKISSPKAFIGGKKANLLKFYSKSIRKIPIKITLKNPILKSNNYVKVGKNNYKPESLMFIRFTTGTTGFPKGVERTYRFMCELFKATHDFSKIREEDVDMTTYPMNILYNLVIGVTSVFASDNRSEKIIKQMKKFNVTTASGSPAFWEKVVEYCKEKELILTDIIFLFTGGGPVSLNLIYDLKQVFPKSKTNIVYGSTEVFPISWIDIDKIIGKKDKITKKTDAMCLGKPHPNLKVRIIKPTLRPKKLDKITLNSGEIGEITISGSHVVKNYFGDKNKKSFKENKIIDNKNKIWHRTGDLGYLEKNEIWFIKRMAK